MRVGILDDETQDLLRRLHRDVQAHRRSPVVQVDEARPHAKAVEQFGDGLAPGGEGNPRQHVGLAVTGHVGRDDMAWASAGMTSRNIVAELGVPCSRSTAGCDGSPAVRLRDPQAGAARL